MCFVAKGCFPVNKKTEDKLFLESMTSNRKAFLDVKSVQQKTTIRDLVLRITLEKSILDEFYQIHVPKTVFY